MQIRVFHVSRESWIGVLQSLCFYHLLTHHRLQKTFKTHMKRLRRTGEGVSPNDSVYYYIDRAGPDHDTPEPARNIWEEITASFKWFPTLYRHWHGRPNLVPICATTAITPSRGPQTILIQGVPSAPPAMPVVDDASYGGS